MQSINKCKNKCTLDINISLGVKYSNFTSFIIKKMITKSMYLYII